VLGHERLGELELGPHDLEPVLLEHELGGFAVTELLSLAHERGQPAFEDDTLRRSSLPQIHMLQCDLSVGGRPPPEGWTGMRRAAAVSDPEAAALPWQT
jgi:hypothetical protein